MSARGSHGQAGSGRSTGGVDGVFDVRGNLPFELVEAVVPGLVPAFECMPAELTGARFNTIGMKAGFLVERDGVWCVRGAEDMTTVATVVAAQEDAKGGATGGRVAVGGS